MLPEYFASIPLHRSTQIPLILLAAIVMVPMFSVAAAESSCNQDATSVSYVFLGRLPDCEIQSSTQVPTESSTLLTISVSVQTTPISRVRFSIPDPPIGSILAENWSFPHVGARDTGIELDLQGCTQTGGFQLGELLVEIPYAETTCEFWRIGTGAEVDDCDGQTRQLDPWDQHLNRAQSCDETCGSWQWCALMPPSELSPAEGAIDLPLDTQPIADGHYLGNLWITSDPSCKTFEPFYPQGNQPWLPDGYLQPGTTYHWYVEYTPGACSNIGATRSETRSFVTVDPVAVVDRPWSGVKRLFR